MKTDNNSTAGDFEHVEESGVDGITNNKRKFRPDNLDRNSQQLDDSNWSEDGCSIVTEKMNKLSAENGLLRMEIQTVKMDNKLTLEKNNVLMAKVDALQAKLEVVELKSQLASEQTAKMVETKMKHLVDQLEEKYGKHIAKTQNNWEEMQKGMEELMSKKLEPTVPIPIQQHQFLKLVTPNAWDKRNEIVTVNELLVTKLAGANALWANVMAKIAYVTFYFEVLVKKKNDDICIGVSSTDCTTTGHNYVGMIPGSWSCTSNGNYRNSGSLLADYFPTKFGNNDIIGIGILALPGTELRVFFVTKNGKKHGMPIILESNICNELYPAVSMRGNFAASSIEANFGNDLASKPFIYNIAEHKF